MIQTNLNDKRQIIIRVLAYLMKLINASPILNIKRKSYIEKKTWIPYHLISFLILTLQTKIEGSLLLVEKLNSKTAFS